MKRAVVFAYHDVGVRCLRALLARGVEVGLVVTHEDDPGEQIWFGSVAAVARECGIPVIKPSDPNTPEVLASVGQARPHFLFSFYYRSLLGAALLGAATQGAYNMHGSLLPKYRGRAPINWAIIHGETETGASLHAMELKADRGAIVDQMAVPILPDDTARDVFAKVTVAAELVLWRSLPELLAGRVKAVPQDLAQGSYYGRRRPEDGRISSFGAIELHNLVRALSRPFPGAFAELAGERLVLWRTQVLERYGATKSKRPQLFTESGELLLTTIDGGLVQILEAEFAGKPFDAADFRSRFGSRSVALH